MSKNNVQKRYTKMTLENFMLLLWEGWHLAYRIKADRMRQKSEK